MDELNGQQRAKLRTALSQAFLPADMIQLVGDFFAPKAFLGIAPVPLGGGGYEQQLFELIDHFNKNDMLPDLVAAARQRRPKNASIADLAERIGLTISGARFDSPLAEPTKPLEKIVQQHARLLNPPEFRAALGPLEGQVCWIALPGGGGGTGFLVGSDLVLTNYHVIAAVKKNPALAPHVVFRFDFKQTTSGEPVLRAKITECRLAAEWWIDGKPPSAKDSDAALGDATIDELDYALLRLDSHIGDEPIGGVTADLKAAPRGWIDLKSVGVDPTVGEQIFLLQHPGGEPLRLSVGTVTGYNGNKSRVRYDANSKKGSSGSPCFNADLQLVALHHAHDTQEPPRWNQAIPIAAIINCWQFPLD
jgi:Trypsin-like peptidase domain/Effector-associated domain 1